MHPVRMTFVLLLSLIAAAAKTPPKRDELSPLDKYIEEAMSHPAAQSPAAPGSLWSPTSRLTQNAADLRATQVDDLVTILVSESASAVVQGTTKTQRQSTVSSSVAAAGGITRAVGPLRNLAGAATQTQLDGAGATSRSAELTAVLSARITRVLPNGSLLVEGNKDVMVNSERQIVTVRGVIRPVDLTSDNVVRSDRITQLELKVNGKGVIGDAVRRPFILYRILMGLLPF
jgi:flagellar L-ring protein FlgH